VHALATFVTGFLLFTKSALSLPENRTNDQVNAPIASGTFQNPSSNVRPRFRYWVPDASVNTTRVALDIADAGRVGAGGVEVLGYYLYDSYAGEYVPVDWATYGWGTEAWKEVFTTAAQAHKDNGLIMDAALGPNQGAGAPAEVDSDGLLWDLVCNSTTITGGSFNGTLPGWGRGTLQAAVLGRVVSSVNTTGLAPGLFGVSPSAAGYRIQNTLATDSLQDVTAQVGSDGAVSLPVDQSQAGNWTLFGFYLTHSELREQESPLLLKGPQSVPRTLPQNGSWIVDHFSALGAQTTISFWENYLLNDSTTKSLLLDVGNYLWEDSVEIAPTIYWTRYVPLNFSTNRGYSINKWLPLLFHENSVPFSETTGAAEPQWYITDEPDAGNKHIADYRQTLTEGYGEYLSTYTAWAESLGLQFSAQVSYNLAMDMLTNIPKVNAPECESLGFSHYIDGYRQYAGPANLAGRRVISSELGANYGDAYEETLPNVLWDITRSLAGGVNQFVIHGYPYSGWYPQTTWPGFTTFSYLFSEMHGHHQPAWDFYSDSLDFIARNQFIFQSGIPKVDLVFWAKYTTYGTVQPFYLPNDLVEAGYTWEYLSPDDFSLPEAYVLEDGVFAPERQAFKAMILRGNDSLTVEGVQKLAEYAHQGLPIIFSGGVPDYLVSYNASGDVYVNEILQRILGLENVHQVPYENLAESIAALGIEPRTKVDADQIWYTYWRRDDKAGADYVFVYNDALGAPFNGGRSKGTVEFASTGTPYLYSAWTGEQTPITNFTQMGNSTSIFFELAGNQSVIVAFHDKNNISPTPGPSGGTGSWSPLSWATLPTYGASLTLSNWTLIVEHWDPPANLTEIDVVALKSNTTHYLPNLTSWLNIPGLQNVSGRGYYSTTFSLPVGYSIQGKASASPTHPRAPVIIDFGAIYHTLRVSVNGHTLPPLDLNWARADISQYLVEGKNQVEAVVATTLFNRLKAMAGELETSGVNVTTGSGLLTDPERGYGLLNEVTLTF
jgi:hypothetical protein